MNRHLAAILDSSNDSLQHKHKPNGSEHDQAASHQSWIVEARFCNRSFTLVKCSSELLMLNLKQCTVRPLLLSLVLGHKYVDTQHWAVICCCRNLLFPWKVSEPWDLIPLKNKSIRDDGWLLIAVKLPSAGH